MPERTAVSWSFLASLAVISAALLTASAAFAQGPPPEPQLWSAVSAMDALVAARTCAADPLCTSYDPPDGLQIDPATGQPLLSVHAKGAMDVGPLLDWAAAHPEVVLVEKLVSIYDMTGFEVDISMDLLDGEAWTSLRDAVGLIAATAYASLHGIPEQADGIHPDLAAAHGAIQACGGDPLCLQNLHELWPWLDAELAIGALQIEVPHNGDPGQHDAIAAELESLTWAEPPWIFAIEPVAGGDHITRAVGRMPSTQLDGLTPWLAGQPWSARSRPMVEDELSEVRLRLETADAAADLVACDGDVGCHYDVSTLHQAVVSPGGRLGVLLHGEDPDIEGLNGLEYPGWSMAPAGYVHDGEAGLLEHQALRELGLGRWNLGEALSVGLDRNAGLVGQSWEDWRLAWGLDDEPLTWLPGMPSPGEVVAVDPAGHEHSFTSIQRAVDASGVGWSVRIGGGTYPEVTDVLERPGLDIQAIGRVIVHGFRVTASSGMTLRGVEVDASSTGLPGIEVTDGITELQVERCIVRGASQTQYGIELSAGSVLQLVGSRLHDNAGAALLLPTSEPGVHLLTDNIFDSNGVGLHLQQGVRAELQNNRVITNAGYGLELLVGQGPLDPELILLRDNTIAMNGGEEIPEQSSMDLGWYAGLLDGTDEDNSTTRGHEHSGLRGIARPERVWQGLLTDEELTEEFPGLSPVALQALIDGRDLIVAGRQERAVEAELHHPILFDMGLGGFEPVDTTDCYSPYYQEPDFHVDYIVDPGASYPLPANVAIDIQAGINLAASGGDTNADGTISICVMPGVYWGGIVLDAASFLQHGLPLPQLRLFGAAGPDATIVRNWHSWWAADNSIVVSRPAPGVDWSVFLGGLTLRDYYPGNPLLFGQPCGAPLLAADEVELTMNQVAFTQNQSLEPGGAVRAEGATVSCSYCSFTGNSADGAGGGIYLEPRNGFSGSLDVTDSIFFGNTVPTYTSAGLPGTRGGAIAADDDAGAVTVLGSAFGGNQTLTAELPELNSGGAVFAQTGPIEVVESTFGENGSAFGGAVGLGFEWDHLDSMVVDSIFTNNSAVEGGAIWTPAGAYKRLIDDVFLRNRAERGGAVYGSELSFLGCLLEENGGIYDEVSGELLEVVAEQGGAVYLHGDQTMPGTTFSTTSLVGNVALVDGGGLFAGDLGDSPAAPVTLVDCHFDSNTAGWSGGAVHSKSITLSVESAHQHGSWFEANQAVIGGGLLLAGGDTVVSATTFLSNAAVSETGQKEGEGGAIALGDQWVGDPAVPAPTLFVGADWVLDSVGNDVLSSSLFYGNGASFAGGAIHLSAGTSTVEEAHFWNNSAESFGGAIAQVHSESLPPREIHLTVTKGTLLESNSTVSSVGWGGGIYCDNSSLADPEMSVGVEHSTIRANSAGTDGAPDAQVGGGGIGVWGPCDVTLTGATIDGNSAASGGGLFVDNGLPFGSSVSPAIVSIDGSDFLSNEAVDLDGGGVRTGFGSPVVVTDTVFADNSAVDNGGGMAVGWCSTGLACYATTAYLEDVEFVSNSARHGGGLLMGNSSDVGLHHLRGGYYANSGSWYGDSEFTHGGGAWVHSDAVFDRVEFLDNSAWTGGAIVHSNGGRELTVLNTLVAHNASCWANIEIEGDNFSGVLLMDHVTVAGNRWLSHPNCDYDTTTGLRIGGAKGYDISDSAIGYNDGCGQVELVAGSSSTYPSGEIVGSLMYSDACPNTPTNLVVGPPEACGPSCLPEFQDPLFVGDGAGGIPYDPGTIYWPDTAPLIFDAHPAPGSPLLGLDESDPEDDIGAFGGPNGLLWCPTASPPPGCP